MSQSLLSLERLELWCRGRNLGWLLAFRQVLVSPLFISWARSQLKVSKFGLYLAALDSFVNDHLKLAIFILLWGVRAQLLTVKELLRQAIDSLIWQSAFRWSFHKHLRTVFHLCN